MVPDQLIPNVELRHRVEQHLRDWAKNRGGGMDLGRGLINSAPTSSRGGTPNIDSDGTGPGLGPSQKQDGLAVEKSTGDNNAPSGDTPEAVQKRKLSDDSQDPINGGDPDRDHPSWKNKKPYTNNGNNNNNNNNSFNQQNMNRIRPPMQGPGNMGFMDPATMFPGGIIPPDVLGKCYICAV